MVLKDSDGTKFAILASASLLTAKEYLKSNRKGFSSKEALQIAESIISLRSKSKVPESNFVEAARAVIGWSKKQKGKRKLK